MADLTERIADRIIGRNILVSRGVAREDRTIDVGEDDRPPAEADAAGDDDAAGDHDD